MHLSHFKFVFVCVRFMEQVNNKLGPATYYDGTKMYSLAFLSKKTFSGKKNARVKMNMTCRSDRSFTLLPSKDERPAKIHERHEQRVCFFLEYICIVIMHSRFFRYHF